MRSLCRLLCIITIIITTLMIFATTQPHKAQALSLKEAVDIALANNPNLSQSHKALDSAKQQLKIAKGQNGFTITLNSSADASKNEGIDLEETASARVSASVPLYTGGRNQANIAAAHIYVQIAQLELSQASDDLIYNVATSYIDALETRANHSVDVETRDNLASHEQLIADLYDAGAKAKIDLLRAKVETSNATQEAISSEATYEVTLTNLSQLLSLDTIVGLNLEDIVPAGYDLQLPDLENCISLLLKAEDQPRRPNLAADTLRIERGEQLLKSAKAAWLPSLSASASTGLTAQSDRWDPSSSATAGLSASWDLFDSHITRAQVDDAQIELERLQLALKADTDSAIAEVVSAHKNLKSALHRLQTTQAAVDLASEERFIATERYRAGEGILLDILDAEVALSTAKKNHLSAKYDVLRYNFALNHALGNTLKRGFT